MWRSGIRMQCFSLHNEAEMIEGIELCSMESYLNGTTVATRYIVSSTMSLVSCLGSMVQS